MRPLHVRRFVHRSFLASLGVVLLIGTKPAHAQNGAVGIATPVTGITIDGRLDDWPKDLQVYPIERVEFGDKLKDDGDLKARFRIGVNAPEHVIYVALEVEDDSTVLDEPGEPIWDRQDGCELFIDAAHSSNGSPFIQYSLYGTQIRTIGPIEIPEQKRKLGIVREDARVTYEWRVEVDSPLDPDRVIGFDVSVADKDKDGSFSWLAWGAGMSKIEGGDRCGEMLLVQPGTRFGELAGRVEWKAASPLALPQQVRVQSSRSPGFWRGGPIDASGSYKLAFLPEGSYTVHPVDTSEIRVEEGERVAVSVEADHTTTADLLQVTSIPFPGLIGAEGILRSAGPVNAEEVDRFVQAYLDYFKTPGISIALIKDSKIVYHRGFGLKNAQTREPVADDTVFEAASMTKPVFADLVMKLVDRGVIDLDTPLSTYLPYEDIAHDERYKLITARMVLTHRTGFPNWRTGKLEIKFTPGTEVSYSGEGFVYLGKVVEKLTGKKLEDLIQSEVFVPLGVEHASLISNDEIDRLTATGHAGRSPLTKWKPKEPNTAASLHVSAGNYAKFLIGVVQGKGLSESAAKEMLRQQVKIPDRPKNSWGLGIAIEETPQGITYGHGGRNTGFTSQSVMFRDLGIGYVFLVNNDDASKFDNVLKAYLITGISGLKNLAPIAHKIAKIDPKLLDAYVGRYEISPTVIVTVSREGDRLMAQASNDGKVEVFPESDTVFFFKTTSNNTMTFVKDDQGAVTHFTLQEDGHDSTAKRLGGE